MSIRIQTVSLAAIVLATGLTAGCDDSAAQAAKSRASLGEALATLEEANRGYVSGDSDQDYSAFRRDKLAQAEGQLETLTQAPDPVTATEARLRLAGVYTTQAYDEVKQAAAAFAGVGQRSRSLFDQLATIQRINTLIVARTGDGGAVLNALGEGDALIRQSKAGVTANLSEIAGQREGAILDAEKHNNAAAGHFTRATEFEKQAFVAATDAEKQEAYTNAYQAQLAGQAAQKQAQDAQILAGRLAQQAAALENEVKLWDKMAQQVGDLTERVRREGDSAARDVSTASSNKGLAIATMKEQHDAITAAYDQGVKARLDTAVDLAKRAIDSLEGVRSAADRSQREKVAFELLSARVTLTQALTRQARYTKDYAGIVRSIAENPAVAGTAAASAAQSQAVTLGNEAQEATERAQAAIDAGLQQIEEGQLAGDDADSMAQALRTYGTQLN
ncbi:MAG: hypothetical protein AAF333_03330 [Planctomycetota bacterium]